jgi:Transglycosylase SLT domain
MRKLAWSRPAIVTVTAVLFAVIAASLAASESPATGQRPPARLRWSADIDDAQHPATVTAAPAGTITPDALIVSPAGLTATQVSRLRAMRGVRSIIVLSAAQISVGGQPASMIGVDPSQFRTWALPGTADDAQLWTAVSDGQFAASATAATRLGLTAGDSYQLTAASSQTAQYAGTDPIPITGIDLIASQSLSRRIGLIPRAAALISAPALSIAKLTARISKITGTSTRFISLRNAPAPAAAAAAPSAPATYLDLFQASAAEYCPALPWTVLAAIGQIESGDGTNDGPSTAGALGPMQFMPATWNEWGIDGFGPPGTPDIMNPLDAVPTAARMLCADGASAGTQTGLRQAIYAYNHASWYVTEVLDLANNYSHSQP